MRDWPADVVLFVLRTQASQSCWWPAWQEIYERLCLHGLLRVKRLEALRTLRDRVAQRYQAKQP